MSAQLGPQPIAVSASTAAKMLDCSRAHIYNLMARGVLRRQQIAGSESIRIPVADLYQVLGLDDGSPVGRAEPDVFTDYIATHPEASATGRHFVYFLRNKAGTVIYVGVSSHLRRRLLDHSTRFGSEVRAVDAVEYPTREEANAAEAAAIVGLRPKHNRALVTPGRKVTSMTR